MKRNYIKPLATVLVAAPVEICAGSDKFKTWHVDHNGDHPSDIEASDDYGKIIYDDGSISSQDDPFDSDNW